MYTRRQFIVGVAGVGASAVLTARANAMQTTRSFAGPMAVEFESLEEAIELAEIFYPDALAEIRRRGDRRVPYEVLGKNPPRDLAFKVVS